MNKPEQAPTDKRTEIKVQALYFSMPNGREIPVPGPHGGLTVQVNSVVAGEKNGQRFEISYLPWLRHHRVVWTRPGTNQRKVFHLHESWCSFETAE